MVDKFLSPSGVSHHADAETTTQAVHIKNVSIALGVSHHADSA